MRIAYLRTVSPTLPVRTVQFLQTNVGFGDWLVLVMMALHLDIKLLTDILMEIEHLGDEQFRSRSCSMSTGVDILPPSDIECDDSCQQLRKTSKGCLKSNNDMLTLKVKGFYTFWRNLKSFLD